MSLRRAKTLRAPVPTLAKPLSFTSRPGAFPTLTSSFPRKLKSVDLHIVEGVGRVGETLRREMPFELPQKIVALGVAREFNGYAALVIRRCRGRGAKIATAQSAQS